MAAPPSRPRGRSVRSCRPPASRPSGPLCSRDPSRQERAWQAAESLPGAACGPWTAQKHTRGNAEWVDWHDAVRLPGRLVHFTAHVERATAKKAFLDLPIANFAARFKDELMRAAAP